MLFNAIAAVVLAVGSMTVPSATDSKDRPEAQAILRAIILVGRDAYDAATNDFQKGVARAQRDKDICELLQDSDERQAYTASNWTGRIVKLDSTSAGNGVLSVEVASDTTVSTFTTDFLDIFETTIRPETQPYEALKRANPDSSIRFSGEFVPSPDGCIAETSLTQRGSMMAPNFLFRFSHIEILLP